MEIRDPVHGTITLNNAETAVLDSSECQRLRAIKQLGFSEFSFPGATHNRYIHSIGVSHLAGLAFDSIFGKYSFSNSEIRSRLRQCFRLAAMLHDVGHGPLSHAIEAVMPPVGELNVEAYKHRAQATDPNARATHEDYTIKFVTGSPLTQVLKLNFPELTPLHVACLIDKTLQPGDDFFIDQGIDFRPILSQLVSSELDVDRMDYLERDSYFCGTNYGKVDLHWILSNLTYHNVDNKLFLALNRRALYTFDDFLISRHHMHLMVYFHHKSIIFEEMMVRYLESPECEFHLPSDISQYTKYTDYKLYEHLSESKNAWAQRISKRDPYKVLIEIHSTEESRRAENIKKYLEENSIDVIWASSSARLSKYHAGNPEDRKDQIFVVDQYDRWVKPMPIDKSTEIFQRYEGARIIDRLYVSKEVFLKADSLLAAKKI